MKSLVQSLDLSCYVLICLDDVLLMSHDLDRLAVEVKLVREAFARAGFVMKMAKCPLYPEPSIEWCGKRWGSTPSLFGYEVDISPLPATVAEAQSAIRDLRNGMVSRGVVESLS